MALLDLALDAVLGALIGAFGGLFGVGGGMIAVPVLALLYGLDQQHAQGTAMVMVAPNVLLGLRRYRQKQAMDNRMALTLAGSAVLATLPFAVLATRVSSTALRTAFACFLSAVGIYLAWRLWRRPNIQAATPRLAWGWSSLVGALGGSLSGLFGLGGAMIAPPALTGLFGLTQTQAQGLALALVAPGTLVSLVTYGAAGDVVWPTGLAMALGGLTTVSAGVALAHRLPERTMRLLFCALLLVTAVALAIRQ
jgi:uncharacterized membrane protein YfcA